jgi:copper(I)-binding protein
MTRLFASAAAILAVAAAAIGTARAEDVHTERNIALSHYWVRASLGTVPTTAGYVVIRTTDGKPDRLVSASSPAAETVELHTHIMKNGIAMMRPVKEIAVPANKPVALKQGGYHLMFFHVKTRLKDGDTVPVTLNFRRAGAVTLSMPVRRGAPGEHMHMH